jgi:hypothetical protein
MSRSANVNACNPGIKRKRRERTPAEELNDADEHKFRAEEVQALKRAEQDDSDYEES